jgi:hypothetical protein
MPGTANDDGITPYLLRDCLVCHQERLPQFQSFILPGRLLPRLAIHALLPAPSCSASLAHENVWNCFRRHHQNPPRPNHRIEAAQALACCASEPPVLMLAACRLHPLPAVGLANQYALVPAGRVVIKRCSGGCAHSWATRANQTMANFEFCFQGSRDQSHDAPPVSWLAGLGTSITCAQCSSPSTDCRRVCRGRAISLWHGNPARHNAVPSPVTNCTEASQHFAS